MLLSLYELVFFKVDGLFETNYLIFSANSQTNQTDTLSNKSQGSPDCYKNIQQKKFTHFRILVKCWLKSVIARSVLH